MLLILSDQTDISTNFVIDWLRWHNVSYLRVDGQVSSVNLKLSSIGPLKLELTDRGKARNVIDLDSVSGFWYRRSDWGVGQLLGIRRHKKSIKRILYEEWDVFRQFVHYLLEQKPHLGSINSDKRQNKLITLFKAASAGLQVPYTLISTDKTQLSSFVAGSACITKAIFEMFEIQTRSIYKKIGTKRVSKLDLEMAADRFFPTLVQREIQKSFELRIFFIREDFYAMAIFSQSDEKTQVDFRNYNKVKPNRNVPFQLPNEIKQKLIRLNQQLNLDTGSIDMIVTPENEYIFLEVNPVGQFGWLSANCNYFLEEKIALNLKNISA